VDRARVFLGISGVLLGASCEPPLPSASRLDRAELTVFYTADLHSHVFPHRFVASERDQALGLGEAGELVSAGGFARLGALLDAERARAERSLYLDGGDLFRGSRAYEAFGGEAELVGMAELGLDAMVLGNHDLDDGAEALAEVMARFGSFPVLATNYASTERASDYLPWVVLDVGGLRVGIIGVANVESVGALERGSEALGVIPLIEVDAVQSALDLLESACDVTIALTHLGLDRDRALVRDTAGVDLVLGAHQHLALDEPELERDRTGREVPIVHVGAYGRYLGRIRLILARRGTAELGLERIGHDFALLPVGDGTRESPRVAAALAPFRAALDLEDRAFAYVETELPRSAPDGDDSALQNLVADSAWLTSPADFALITSSSLRADLLPGPLTPSALYEALPFDEPLVRALVRGHELERLFQALETRAARYGCETPVMIAGAALRFDCGEGVSRRGLYVAGSDRACLHDAECPEGVCAPSSSGSRQCLLEAPAGPLLAFVTTRFLLDDYGIVASSEFVGSTLRDAVAQRVAAAPPDCPNRLPCVRPPAIGRVEVGAR
jgi:5'-nucleotidase/UDP-sugar diphosphatase